MKNILLVFMMTSLTSVLCAQTPDSARSLPHFTKIIASPRIHIILKKGDRESITLSCHNIDLADVNVRVTGKKLRIFLSHARMVDSHLNNRNRHHIRWENRYATGSVTATITYRQIREIEVRGDQELTCVDEINSSKLKIRAYGEVDITLASVQTGKLKASLYGENHLLILKGGADHQVFRLFGENKIDTRGLESVTAATRIIGEGNLKINVKKQVHISAIGEPDIYVNGTPHITRGLIIGHADIHRK